MLPIRPYWVYIDVRGRDLASTVQDLRAAVTRQVPLKAGMSIAYSGQFEYLERANARLNGVEKSIRFSSVPLISIRRHFDLITANILSGTLIELAPHLKKLVAPGGRIVLGGFLADEADEVLSQYRSPLRCLSRKTHRGWTTLVMARAPR